MPFGSKRFLHEATLPAVRDGLAAAGRDEADLAIVPEIIVSVGDDHDAARRLLAFYGSTPAYRPVLDARLGRSAARAQRAVQTGPLAGDGFADRRRGAAYHRGVR